MSGSISTSRRFAFPSITLAPYDTTRCAWGPKSARSAPPGTRRDRHNSVLTMSLGESMSPPSSEARARTARVSPRVKAISSASLRRLTISAAKISAYCGAIALWSRAQIGASTSAADTE